MRSWVIGSNPECDVVVDSPLASGRHCQLTHTPLGLSLEDLGSTNGTYVDGNRITAATQITPAQEITLGQTVAMPWPSELVKFVRIGRVPGNEIVLEDPRVSSRHARLMIVAGSEALIEDLGSSNGTFLNSVEARVTRLTSLSSSDTVYFGSLAVPASRLLAGLQVAAAQAAVTPARTERREPSSGPVAAPAAVSFVEGNRWLLAALAQAPLLAFLIVLVSGRQAAALTEASWSSVAQAITATTFATAVAAVWLGCSLAVAELAGGLWPGRRHEAGLESLFMSLGSRLAVLVSVCALGCALLLAIVYWGAGFKGPWLSMWGVLVMASIVCLLLGLLVSSLVRSWAAVVLALLGCFALVTALGGWWWPLAGKGLPVTVAAGATPARWAFEGMLLLESPHHPSPAPVVDGRSTDTNRDLAEDFFPADTERMGAGAASTALGLMAIGMAAAVALASTRPR